MVEVMKIMATSLKRSHDALLHSCPDPAAGRRQPTPPLETPRHPQASLGKSLVGSQLLSPGSWCAQDFVSALQESVSPVLCNFWRLYSGANGNLLQEGIYHIQVYCTQSPCPCSSPHSNTVLAQSLWGLWVLVCKVHLSPLSISGRYGV